MPDKTDDENLRNFHHSSRDPDTPHVLSADLPPVEAPKLDAEARAAEKARAEAAPQTADPNARPAPRARTVDHEADWSKLSEKEVPRHDRYADENTNTPTPARVVPSTPTNANPAFADYATARQDRPGFADGTDAAGVAQALADKPRDPKLSTGTPEGPVAGEGAFAARATTASATGASSPIGDAHNDPAGTRVADSKAAAEAVFTDREAAKATEAGFVEPGTPAVEVVDGVSTTTAAARESGGRGGRPRRGADGG